MWESMDTNCFIMSPQLPYKCMLPNTQGIRPARMDDLEPLFVSLPYCHEVSF